MEYFTYVRDYRLLGCRSCYVMVTKDRIKEHLQKAPHKLCVPERNRAWAWADQLDIIQSQQEIHDRLPLVPDTTPPIAALGAPRRGGFRCTATLECAFVGTSLRRIRQHLKEEHAWTSNLTGGRRSAAAAEAERREEPWRSGVYYQRFFRSGTRSAYFEVARGLHLALERSTHHAMQARLQEVVDVFQAKGNNVRRQEAGRIEGDDDARAPNPWLRRLGSALHLKDFSGKKDFLRGLISMDYRDEAEDSEADPVGDPPDESGLSDDAALRFIHMAFDRMVHHAKSNIRPDILSWNALFEVNRKELQKERSRPFHFRFKPETQRRYTLVVKQLLAYIVRCMSLEDSRGRPPFRLSTRQQEAYENMMDHADALTDAWAEHGGDLEASEVATLLDLLEKDVLSLYISVLDHFTKDTEYESVLVSFLTVLSIRADGTWEGYDNFTPKLSAIMAISRLCIVQYAVHQRMESIKRKTREGQTPREAEEDSPSHFALISGMTRRFMVGGGEGWEATPTQFIIRLRNFGMAAHNNTAARGSIGWDNEHAVYQGGRFSVIDVQAMLRTALQWLEKVLYRELLFCSTFREQAPAELGLPRIPWDELLDNAADETIGHSFVDKLFQHDGGASRGWVIRAIMQDTDLRTTWIRSVDEGRIELDGKRAYEYGLQVEKALELLLFLVHLSGGFPPRANELLVTRHRNTGNGGVRNILVDKGLVMIVTGVHKGFSTTERLKIIHRFLPREVGTLLVYFLWLVLPFWEDVQANVWDRTSFDAGLWTPEEVDEADEAGEVGEAGTDGAANPAGGTGPAAPQQRGGGGDDSPVRSTQAQSRQEGVLGPWPGARWTSPRLSRIIRRISVATFGGKLNISSWRHVSTAMGRRYFRDASTAHTKLLNEMASDDSDSDSGGEDDGDSPYDLQAGHGSRTAGLIYGRLVTEGAFETNERRVHFRYISEEWHRLFGFRSATSGFVEVLQPGRKRKHASVHDEAVRDLQLRRWKVRRRVDLDRALRRLYGEEAQFRGVQREAIRAIMMNRSPVVVVMGTGGGKSLSFMLPAASCPGGVTVVVVPLVSLQGDLMERCQKMKIPCAEWRSDRSPGAVSLVFVTPESAMTKRFQDYIEGLRVTAQLDGFVVDEAHTILEGSRAFRPKLRELGQLALVGVQVVYLTATLPPRQENEFFTLINAREEDVTMIRARTTRSNVGYSVQTLVATSAAEAGEMMVARVRAILDQKLEAHPWPAKMIVYCHTVKATTALAAGLGCDAYHREVDTRDGKAERLRAWTSGMVRERYGGGRVIVATNALGLGIDVPDIRVVMHVEMPFTMADYAQQSGRAGRDGQRSEAIMVRVVAGQGGAGDAGDAGDAGGHPGPEQDFIGGRVCRRVVLDSVMDGRFDRDRCEDGEVVCDVCGAADKQAALEAMAQAEDAEEEEEADLRQRDVDTQRLRSRVVSRTMREAEEVAQFKERLNERLFSGCSFCGNEAFHSAVDCKMAREGDGLQRQGISMARRMEDWFRREVGLEAFGGCFQCFLPQELCTGWEEVDVEGGWRRVAGRECRYKGVLLSTIAYVYTALPEEAEALFFTLGFQAEGREGRQGGKLKQEGVWRWMGRRIDWGGLEGSNLCRVFVHMADAGETMEVGG